LLGDELCLRGAEILEMEKNEAIHLSTKKHERDPAGLGEH